MSFKEDLIRIIEEIGFQEDQVLKFSETENYIVSKGKFLNKKAILKISTKKNQARVDRLLKEILIDKITQDFESKFNKKTAMARVVKSGEIGQYFWMLKDYISGTPLGGETQPDDPLYNNPIKQELLPKSKKIIDGIVSNLKILRQIKDARLYSIPKRFYEQIEEYDLKAIENDLGISLSTPVNYYKSKANNYFKSSFRSSCDGDLTPSNIIVTPDDQISFSDLEWFCADNYMVDFTFLWLYLWKNPNWQEKLNVFLKTKEEKEFFRCSIIRLTIHSFDFVLEHTKHKEKRIEDLKNHIFVKYLMAASKSVDDILNINEV